MGKGGGVGGGGACVFFPFHGWCFGQFESFFLIITVYWFICLALDRAPGIFASEM